MKEMIASMVLAFVLGGAGICTADEGRTEKMSDEIMVWSVEQGELVPSRKVEKTDADWKQELSPEAYDITRKQGTERAFSGTYWDNKREGVYRCVACENDLFLSSTKYESGTGWPSFFKPVDEANVGIERDRKLFTVRTEVHCARCGAHLGHVFEDGPKPTGLRYCLNSASLDFVEMELP